MIFQTLFFVNDLVHTTLVLSPVFLVKIQRQYLKYLLWHYQILHWKLLNYLLSDSIFNCSGSSNIYEYDVAFWAYARIQDSHLNLTCSSTVLSFLRIKGCVWVVVVILHIPNSKFPAIRETVLYFIPLTKSSKIQSIYSQSGQIRAYFFWLPTLYFFSKIFWVARCNLTDYYHMYSIFNDLESKFDLIWQQKINFLWQ